MNYSEISHLMTYSKEITYPCRKSGDDLGDYTAANQQAQTTNPKNVYK